jgi:hypothetical protein
MKLNFFLKKVAAITVGYAEKQENKEKFDEECATVNEEKAGDPTSKQNQSCKDHCNI